MQQWHHALKEPERLGSARGVKTSPSHVPEKVKYTETQCQPGNDEGDALSCFGNFSLLTAAYFYTFGFKNMKRSVFSFNKSRKDPKGNKKWQKKLIVRSGH